jgi:hypothetical protein
MQLKGACAGFTNMQGHSAFDQLYLLSNDVSMSIQTQSNLLATLDSATSQVNNSIVDRHDATLNMRTNDAVISGDAAGTFSKKSHPARSQSSVSFDTHQPASVQSQLARSCCQGSHI